MATDIKENKFLDNEGIKVLLEDVGFNRVYNIADEDIGKDSEEIKLLLEITEMKFNIIYLKCLLNKYIEYLESFSSAHETSIMEIRELYWRIEHLEDRLEHYTNLNYTLC